MPFVLTYDLSVETSAFNAHPYLINNEERFVMTEGIIKRRASNFKDISGNKYGRWKVDRFSEIRNGNAHWECTCDCGGKKTVIGSQLRNGDSKSCGCLMRELLSDISRKHGPNPQDFTGEKFGRLTIINRVGKFKCLCLCECGRQTSPWLSSLKNGNTKSCGCLNREAASKRKITHGETSGGKTSPEFRAWSHIKTRTTNPKSLHFERYGGRGIKICDRWLNSFENFLADMGRRPSNKYSIDRINNNGNYEPGNCRWATATEQCRNRSSNVHISYEGKIMTIVEWAEYFKVGNKIIYFWGESGRPIERLFDLLKETMGYVECR